jgi:hypothetical protein
VGQSQLLVTSSTLLQTFRRRIKPMRLSTTTGWPLYVASFLEFRNVCLNDACGSICSKELQVDTQ